LGHCYPFSRRRKCVYLIAANRSGAEDNGKIEFAGHSRVVSPKGEILAQADNADQVIVAEIDLSVVADQRRAVPYLSDLGKLELLSAQRYVVNGAV
jgi:predicted amidohydrolase